MPVTSFALLVLGVIAAAGVTLWALSVWGLTTVLPVALCLALAARWALAHVPYDDGQA